MNLYQQAKQIEVSNDIIKEIAKAFGDEYARYARGAVYMMRFGQEIPRLKIMWDVVRKGAKDDASAMSSIRDIIRMYFRRVWDWRRQGYPHEPSITNMYDRFNSLRMDVAEEAYYKEKRQREIESARAADIIREITE